MLYLNRNLKNSPPNNSRTSKVKAQNFKQKDDNRFANELYYDQ